MKNGVLNVKRCNTQITIYDDNVSGLKNYCHKYNVLKHTYCIPEYMIDHIKNDVDFKIYNTLDAQQKYIDKWIKLTKPNTFNNVPKDFIAKTYIALNKDLSYMTEIDAMLHYEITGHIENMIYKFNA